jgi:hypothetical protein
MPGSPELLFFSLPEETGSGPIISVADRFCRENRDPVCRSKSVPDFSGTVFNRDGDRDCGFKIGIRLQNKNR